MNIKTSELEGAALDWAVAKCEGHDMEFFQVVDAFMPSTDWAQAGPIIERKCICLARLDPKTEDDTNFWVAHIDGIYCRYGLTALIAAMRCYVASNLGDEMGIPGE
jgi:hypothetical protein